MRAWTFAVAFVALTGAVAIAADWDARALRDEKTLEFMTVNAGGEEHWSTVWLVVIDGDVYVNLGKRAVRRLDENTHAPFISVRIGDREFARIRVEPAQERQPEVAAAIAAKYWTGFLVPYRAPSQVMRLRPEKTSVGG